MNAPFRLCRNAVALAACLIVSQGFADSAIPLLGGFDTDRIDAVYPPSDEDSLGELSKLVFRLRTVDPKFLAEKVSPPAEDKPLGLGDAVSVEGEIVAIAGLKVPDRLIEFLELKRLQVIDIESADARTRVITADFPREAKLGDRVRGTGVVIEISDRSGENDSQPSVVATPRLGWSPKSPAKEGWKMLSAEGVDVSQLANVATRNKLPLMAADGDAFYSLLAAAHRISGRQTQSAAKNVSPVSLLREPKDYGGEWMHMSLESVQVTRVAVTEPHRQEQLGSDHYYQIDAVGDLGNVVVQIKRPEGDDGPPARFENRFPVSLVIRELPEFLRQRIRAQEGGDAMVAEINMPIAVDGFFFRLWSYSTDYMRQYGGGDQFGPLLVAANITSQDRGEDPAGVGIIAWIAAGAILSGILGIWFWNRATSKRDEQVREKRKQSESQQIQLPDQEAAI